ncbi:amidohydrolase family protein [Deferrisoma camini]|uniref:amidohydrolase family protein n=1 Tax=Deferrisoma camini TaxID=1035120 RepID=UPI00046D69DA|nr:amidohydrolase family protein [Deferrisoma camini]
MILDAHTHIAPPELRQDRRSFFAGEPDFELLYRDPKARLIGATDLVEYLDANRIQAACSFGFPWNDDGKTRLCDDYVLDAAARYPGRIVPFACVNPLRGRQAVREAERCLSAGARGLGEIATCGAGLGPEVRSGLAPLAELAAEAGVPVLLHTNEAVGHSYPGKAPMSLEEIYQLVRRHPRTRWILAHWGGGLFVYHLLRREADDVLANVWYDTAAGPFLYKPDVFRRFLNIAGADRLVFGSDYPLLGLPRYLREMDAAGVRGPEREAVLGGNLARLLGLGEGA